MWPKSFWYKVYEPFIRKAAGMGKASLKSDPDRYEHHMSIVIFLLLDLDHQEFQAHWLLQKMVLRSFDEHNRPRWSLLMKSLLEMPTLDRVGLDMLGRCNAAQCQMYHAHSFWDCLMQHMLCSATSKCGW